MGWVRLDEREILDRKGNNWGFTFVTTDKIESKRRLFLDNVILITGRFDIRAEFIAFASECVFKNIVNW